MTRAAGGRKPVHKITLVEKPGRHLMERTPRYDVMLNGARWGELYFNMTGYVGHLPTVQGGRMDIGERPISAFRKEAATLNREAERTIEVADADSRRIAITRPSCDNRMIFAISMIDGEHPRAHLLNRREYDHAMALFGGADVGLGFFQEHPFPDGETTALVEPGDGWILEEFPDLPIRKMSDFEAGLHRRRIDRVFDTVDDEIKLVVATLPGGSDALPGYVTRQSLDFGRHVFGDGLRAGDLAYAGVAALADPEDRAALAAAFPDLDLPEPDLSDEQSGLEP
ncbi:hypothetical protein [Defluviimonas salinarum]|uniref:Uncharacterized protein n=1 Tax=Defluviimonas salinarum TaxID=2992147 RepID=A0ABT3J5L9_9RHOB|nr:hypothetical protein [Defluviimonas salinarum]MCW3782990.1 hypothetical protein [Defluviimonas salinarum]